MPLRWVDETYGYHGFRLAMRLSGRFLDRFLQAPPTMEPIDLAALEIHTIASPAARAGGNVTNIAGSIGISDEELIVRAVRDAQSLLAEHIERLPSDAEETISQLLEILDRQNVVLATNRLCRESGLRPLNQP